MNKEIIAAVERLFSACLEVTAAGKYHAHMSYAAHVDKIDITVYHAATQYIEGDGREPQLSASVWIDGPCADAPAEVVQTLNALTDRLYGMADQGVAA